jgi:predicted AlkP superfamily phosphohydrolase/phosphomutase
MPLPPTKVLVLGIDAANPALVKQWAEDGTLPNIRSLLARGLLGDTWSLDGFFVGSTWPSFYTGVTPARHGVHYQVQLKPGTYEFHRPASGEFVKCAPFWSHLSHAGRRVAVLDVPLSRIDRSLNGIQVVEWAGHDAVYGFQTWPTHVAETIRSQFGSYPLAPCCDAIGRSAEDYRAFIDALVRGARTKASLTREFLQQGGWDFFMQVFTETHCAGHQCWHLHDVTHPAHDPSLLTAMGDPLRRVYAAVDTAIGELLEHAGAALVVVLVAHGMSYWYGAQFLLQEILFRLGVAQPPPASPARTGALSAAVAGARGIWRRLPHSIRGRLAPVRDRLLGASEGAERLPTIGVDPQLSSCFPVNNGLAVGGIRLNLIGREPQGMLQPGSEADAFCGHLAEVLLDIVDERTDGALVRRVLRTADLYTGEHLDDLPDLLVEWSDAVPTGSMLVGGGAGAVVRARSPTIGIIEGVNHYGRTGEHRPQGLFIAAGPGVRPGRLDRVASILDFAPTFASLLHVNLPHCDGQPLPELL